MELSVDELFEFSYKLHRETAPQTACEPPLSLPGETLSKSLLEEENRRLNLLLERSLEIIEGSQEAMRGIYKSPSDHKNAVETSLFSSSVIGFIEEAKKNLKNDSPAGDKTDFSLIDCLTLAVSVIRDARETINDTNYASSSHHLLAVRNSLHNSNADTLMVFAEKLIKKK